MFEPKLTTGRTQTELPNAILITIETAFLEEKVTMAAVATSR
jgi:hypothetical protein